MTEVFDARASVEGLRHDADAAQAAADELAAVVRRLQDAVRTGTATQEQLAAATVQQADRQRAADDLRNALGSAQDALAATLGALPPLFEAGTTDPIVLLPVRLETVWWDASTLRIRVYPDDLHVSGFDPALTPEEAAAGTEYWAAPGDDAWQRLSARIRPARAAWTRRATRPGAPPATVRAEGDGAGRPRSAVALPARWRFVGLTDGAVVVDRTPERPVPDPLPVDLLRAEDGWATDWFEARKAGMAIEVRLPPGVDHLDQLFVLGVRPEPAADGGARLQELLLGHAFGAGLGLLRAGTPTNNTPRTRSGWSSHPEHPGPEDPPPDGRQVAQDVATALGLPDAPFLRSCPGADDREAAAVAALTLLTWPTLGKGVAEAAVTHLDLADQQPRTVDSALPWRAVRDHLAAAVRSRGPLPVLRIGRQPYGLLPASSLDDWRAERTEDADAVVAPWLRRLRERWRGVLDVVPRVVPDQPVDQVAVDVLNRLPVASGLAMRRMDGPGFTVPRTPKDEPPAQLGVPGLAPDGALRWSAGSDGWTDLGWGLDEQTGVPRFVPLLTPDPEPFRARVLATADFLRDVRAFLAGELDAAGYDARWPVVRSSGEAGGPRPGTLYDLPAVADPDQGRRHLIEALLFLPNWAFMDGDDGTGDPIRQALAATADVDQLVADTLDGIDDPDRPAAVAAAARWSTALTQLETAFRALTAVPPERLPELLLEVIDVHAHRLDAWITSLATRRLAQLRARGSAGARVGAYGWVENLRPPEPHEEVELDTGEQAIVSPQDGYVHAPSLQHAATAAVLRSGFLAHPGEQTFAVDLSSRRARVARWLLGGVRLGQSLGALLGYRFERALHDAELDTEIEGFRRDYPSPTVPPPEGHAGDAWRQSAEAIAARNVVDGLALARAGSAALDTAHERDRVAPLLDDLTDALDAVGDLILAESVHQLVGGSPLRAGLAADTLGRGTDVPDAFGVLATPHRARAVTSRVAAVLPAGSATATGWPADPLAQLLPEVAAWVGHLLGPPSGWQLGGVTGTGPAAARFDLTADRLGVGALTAVLDAAGADHPRLAAAVRAAAGATPDAPVTFDGPGWIALVATAGRLRSLLADAQPLLPRHLPGAPDGAPDGAAAGLSAVRDRLAAFAADPAVAGTPAGARLAELAATDPTAAGGGAEGWLTQARTALADVLGADVPLLPALPGPLPAARADAPPADVGAWLQRYGDVRPVLRTLHETLLLSTVRAGRGEPLRAAQDPTDDGDAWIGGPFPAGARPRAGSHLVWHAPLDLPAGVPLAGLVLDEWTELLPGGDQLRAATPSSPAPASPAHSELTGVAFHYDRPDAQAPQGALVAVPPDPARGWTAEDLLQVVRETCELAKLRAVDVRDLPLLGSLLPAIRLSPQGATGALLTAMEEHRPGTDPDGPFRLEPGRPETLTEVASGLAARVHDPLWLLTRQWQFGEFAAQDAGSPAVVQLAGHSAPVDAWRPAGTGSWIPYDVGRGPLDASIEAEPQRVDLRLRAEGGAHLLRLLDDAGLREAGTAALAPLLLPAGPADGSLVGLVGGRLPDAAAVAAALDAGSLGAALGEAGGRWRQWWADRVRDRGPDSFDPHRFEHAAELSVAGTVLRAAEYLGDGLGWHCVDVDPDAEAAPAGPAYVFADEGLPTTVRYGGLPADRFWEMEDALVDLGATDVSMLDTGRLLLISFATVYGNDWFLVPLEVPGGSLTVLDQLLVRDVFGRQHLLQRAGRDDPSWSMFALTSPDPTLPAATGLLVLPPGYGQPGDPLERVGLARDELANLAWAVQHRYTDERGEPVERRDRWLAAQPVPGPAPAGGVPAYGVQTVVPDYWFPLVPEAVRPAVIRFRLGTLTGPGLASRPEGRLLAPDLWVHEEEVPRDGVQLARRPVLARWFDGGWHTWTRREKGPGAGESASGLAFDTVRPTEPWPG